MSAQITFSELLTYAFVGEGPEAEELHLPLSELGGPDEHIHGRLEIRIDDRALPQLGFWGPDDVCFNTWIEEFGNIARELGGSPFATYVFDEGEQGQPAFQFKREGEVLLVSVIDSQVADGSADPSFQSVRCNWTEFAAQMESFLYYLHHAQHAAPPRKGPPWWEKNARPR